MDEISTIASFGPIAAHNTYQGFASLLCNARANILGRPTNGEGRKYFSRWRRWIYYRADIPQNCETAQEPCENDVYVSTACSITLEPVPKMLTTGIK
jgi:hypothetical protein